MNNKEDYIERFKDIYQRKNGRVLSVEEALGHFERLVVLVDAIYKPILKRKYDEPR